MKTDLTTYSMITVEELMKVESFPESNVLTLKVRFNPLIYAEAKKSGLEKQISKDIGIQFINSLKQFLGDENENCRED